MPPVEAQIHEISTLAHLSYYKMLTSVAHNNIKNLISVIEKSKDVLEPEPEHKVIPYNTKLTTKWIKIVLK